MKLLLRKFLFLKHLHKDYQFGLSYHLAQTIEIYETAGGEVENMFIRGIATVKIFDKVIRNVNVNIPE